MPRNQYLQLFIETNNQIHRPKQKNECGPCNAQSQEREAGQTDRQTDRSVSVGPPQRFVETLCRGCSWHLCSAPSPSLQPWGEGSALLVSRALEDRGVPSDSSTRCRNGAFGPGLPAVPSRVESLGTTYSAQLRFEFVLLRL